MRTVKRLKVTLTENLKKQLLCWAQQYDEVVWLDSNNHNQKHSSYQALLAVDAFTAIKTDSFHAFDELEEYQSKTKDWLFGYLTYDLKNDVENLRFQILMDCNFQISFSFSQKNFFYLLNMKWKFNI